MIRIIFDNGELMECEHINKIYIDTKDTDKICIVGELLDKVYPFDRSVENKNCMPWYMDIFNTDKIKNIKMEDKPNE